MKKRITFFILILFLFSAAGCGRSLNQQTGSSNIDLPKSKAVVTHKDFVYSLISEKGEYKEGEDIQLYAELEYIGDAEEIDIYHAASPFYFDMEELTRQYKIYYPMEEPLIKTTIKKGEKFRQEYIKSGGFSGEDSADFKDFMKELIESDGFPNGEYIVNGTSDFYIEENGENTTYKIEAQIGFKVGK